MSLRTQESSETLVTFLTYSNQVNTQFFKHKFIGVWHNNAIYDGNCRLTRTTAQLPVSRHCRADYY